MSDISSSYLDSIFDRKKSRLTIKGMVQLIKLSEVKFDTIVFRGMSGALIAPIIAHQLRKRITLCRKDSDDSHSGHGFAEGYKEIKRYVIIDDFINEGHTVRSILKTINVIESNAECVGIFLYRSNRGHNFEGNIPVYSLDFNFLANKPRFCGDNLPKPQTEFKA